MIKEFESKIIEDTMMNINLIFGNEKNSFLGVTMLKHCPINISVKNNDSIGEPTCAKEFIHNNMAAWVARGERGINIELSISKDKEQKLLDFISKNNHIITYVVIHEFLHILRLDNTTSVTNMHRMIYDDLDMINSAMDYNINLTVSELLSVAKINTEMDNIGLYDEKYEEMTSIEILEDLKNNGTKTVENFDDNTRSITIDNQNTIGSTTRSKKIEPITKDGEESDSRNVSMANSIANAIARQAGDQSKKIIGEKLLKVKTNSDWFNELRKSLSTALFMSISGTRSTWSNINLIYKHIFKAPATYKKKRTISNIILYIDSSGSVRDRDLGKVIDIIDSNKKKIDTITIKVFDTRIVTSTKTKDKKQMVDIVSKRIACGGTDIKAVISDLESYKSKELNDSIVMIISDMYFSDVQAKVLNKTIRNYWVHASDSRNTNGLYPNSTCIYI